MKIACVAPYVPEAGGISVCAEQLATRMAAQGHEIEVLTQAVIHGLPGEEVIEGVTVRRFKVPVPSKYFPVAPGLWTFLAARSGDYDLIHSHGYHQTPALAAALTKRGPLVFSPYYHGTGHSSLRKALHVPYRLGGSYIFSRADRVICISEPEAKLVCSHFPKAADRVAVIPTGVDSAALDAAVPFPVAGRVLLTAGRLDGYKGVDRVIGALAHLGESYSLHVTGDGPERRRLMREVRQASLESRVHLYGHVELEDLHRWFRTASVYVTMSSNESMNLALVEALAAGAAAVASDIPAHRTISDGIGAGRVSLVRLDIGPSELAQRIAAVSDALTEKRLPAPRLRSWASFADETEDVYRSVMAGC